jgi:photosystem II stability/assembly factor-like uncharacterized protein
VKNSENSIILCGTVCVVFLFCMVAGCTGGRGEAPKPPPNLYKITGANLHSVSTAGKDKIWVSGSSGAIYHTMDGGNSWSRQSSPVDNLICSIDFLNENMGWASGNYGTIIHTEDGGKTWVQQNVGTKEHLFSICFMNRSQGWTVGSMGTILHTSDGGKTWAVQREQEDKNFNAVCFINQTTGWVVGEFGTVLHTADGGKSWVRQKPAPLFLQEKDQWADPPLALYGVTFVDSFHGWIVGMHGVLLRTEDGGNTWIDLRGSLNINDPLYAVEIKDDRGWVVGDAGVYLFSEDGGKSWQFLEDRIKTRFWLHDVTFCDHNRGWVVGARGAVVKTEDGGKTWTMLSGLTYDVPEFGLADF